MAASKAFRDGLAAAGLGVQVNGTEWELTPDTVWRDETSASHDGIRELDVEGVRIEVTLAGETQPATAASVAGVINRVHIDTMPSRPFHVPVEPGELMRLRIVATCDARADGRPLRAGPLRRVLLDGLLEVPNALQTCGAPGHTIFPREGCYAFLHVANVAGERRYTAVHFSLIDSN